MKKIIPFFCFLFLIPTVNHQVFAQTQIDTEKLDLFFSSLEEHNRFMGSVAILQGDELLFNAAYGVIDEDETPAGSDTVYRIGSISKSFTAAMILQLIEQGKLSPDTKLEEFFPTMPNADRITIKQLLQHRSGLVNFTDLPEYMEYHTRPKSRDELLSHFREIGTGFEPGESQAYSNTAYVLLSFIIEEITGLEYADALEEMITTPAGLQSTYYGRAIDTTLGETESFRYADGRWTVSVETDMSIPQGAGAIVSTSAETALFYRHLFEGNLLSEASLTQMTIFDGPFGLGLIRFPFHDKTAIGHSGGIDEFRANAAHFRDDDLTFAILASGVNYNFNDILIGLLSITFGHDYEIPDFSERQTVQLSEEQLQLYEGTYSAPNFPLEIRLFVQNGSLMAQATGQGAFPLTTLTEKEMVFEPAGVEIEFEEKTDGRYTAFHFSQSGMEFRFSLKEE